MADLTFTFPFTVPTLVVALLSYVAVLPPLTTKLNTIHKGLLLGSWLGLVIGIGIAFPLIYGLHMLIGLAIMVASRERLQLKGIQQELCMLVIALVCAMLFVGLR